MSEHVGPDSPIASFAASSHDGSGEVLTQLHTCVSCGYSLLGLTIDDRCPECGSPVAHSMRRGVLQYASRHYIAQLHRGALMEEIAAILSPISLVATFLSPFLRHVLTRPGTTISLALLEVGLAALSVFAFWLLTAVDPGYPDSHFARLRRLLRGAAALMLGIAMLRLLFVLYVGVSISWALLVRMPSPSIAWLALAIGVASCAVTAAQFLASMNYVALLAARVPDKSLHDNVLAFRWQGPLWYLLGGFLCLVGPFVAIILYAMLFDRLRLHLKNALKIIDQNASRSN